MDTIWKFQLLRTDRPSVFMPDNAQILHAEMQGGEICIWALVDPEARRVQRTFAIVGTGNPFHDSGAWEHVGTVFDGPFVWHVFS